MVYNNRQLQKESTILKAQKFLGNKYSTLLNNHQELKLFLTKYINLLASTIIKKATESEVKITLVRVVGIGPTTSVLSGQRSTTELHSRVATIAK